MPTIKDVALKAGVTVTTVSRVMNNRGYLSAKTKEKVRQAMQELDYHPSEVARSLAQKQTTLLGVIVPSLLHPYYSEVINALEYHASILGLKLLVCNAQRNAQKEAEYIDMLKANKVAGIILCTQSRNAVSSLVNLPVVTLERSISPSVPAVLCDNEMGGRLAAEHLLSQGCKHLVMIHGGRSSEERVQGFTQRCEKASVSFHVVQASKRQFNQLDYADLINTLFTDNPAIDGVFASSDVIAAQVIQICHKRGLCIPTEVKVIGFDDVDLARLLSPALSTIHQPIEELCAQAIQTIVGWESTERQSRIVLPVSLIQRSST
ncbi:LacI family DNA-binding transcriptional regulator [uncultured Sphaerochaeta sp.]|uniref:LacI family DNA-binding transcriptional regulator n=1 Tax=uncultured Sphaerochaeta sp. TaxID=886478 RepID=UPI002A0A337B|nr:LacI family DNA-binding transcriptional regulator [uncultured Sphaerochaeta sp.]